MKKMLLPLIAACCLAPVAAFAAHPLVGDSVETVAPSKFEAETAVEYSSNKVDIAGGTDKTTVFKVQETITGGIVPKLDAFVSVPYLKWKNENPAGDTTESGLSDITVGVKYNFMNAEKIALAVKPFVVLPSGDDKKGLGAGKVGVGANLIASLELAKRFAIDANAGLTYQPRKGTDVFGNDLKAVSAFNGSVAGKYEATAQLKAVAEIAMIKSNAENDDKVKVSLAAGAIFAAMPYLDVDLGARVGLSKEAEDYILLAGATFKF